MCNTPCVHLQCADDEGSAYCFYGLPAGHVATAAFRCRLSETIVTNFFFSISPATYHMCRKFDKSLANARTVKQETSIYKKTGHPSVSIFPAAPCQCGIQRYRCCCWLLGNEFSSSMERRELCPMHRSVFRNSTKCNRQIRDQSVKRCHQLFINSTVAYIGRKRHTFHCLRRKEKFSLFGFYV
jgi:hypothetical protein